MDSDNNTACKNRKLVLEAMSLAEKMLAMANHGTTACEDDGCLLIYGVIRDCGYKIRRIVEYEKFSKNPECDDPRVSQ